MKTKSPVPYRYLGGVHPPAPVPGCSSAFHVPMHLHPPTHLHSWNSRCISSVRRESGNSSPRSVLHNICRWIGSSKGFKEGSGEKDHRPYEKFESLLRGYGNHERGAG